MQKKEKFISELIGSIIIVLVGAITILFIVNILYDSIIKGIYVDKITQLETCSQILIDSLNITNESIEKLEQDEQKEEKIIYTSALSSIIYKLENYNVLDEKTENIELYKVDNNSSHLIYQYNDELNENDLNFLVRNDTEVIGEMQNDRFVIVAPVKNKNGLKIASLRLVTGNEKYIERLNECKRSLFIHIIMICIVAFALIICKILLMLNAYSKDIVTGLESKIFYKKSISKLIKRYPNYEGIMIVIGFKNIENFEMPNIELIEEVMIEFAKRLKKYKNHKTVLAKVSEQKVGLYIHTVKNEDKLKEEIIKDVEDLLRSNTKYKSIQYYMGISFYPYQERKVEALVNGAIYAVEQLKKDKKQYHTNNYLEYDPKSHREFIDKQYLYDEVNRILQYRDVYIVFQPIVDIRTGEIFGYEALSRPVSDLVPNIGMLLSLAEEMKITSELEMILIYQINKTVYANREKFNDKHLFINTNVSIKYGEREIEKFKYVIEKIVKNLVIEITEYTEIDFDIITEKVNRVKDFGAKIAIDDFGSGYSNELALLSLIPDIVKIDLGLIRGIDQDERKLEIVTGLVAYAKKNGIKVLAEGVETPQELRVVKSLDIDYVQGYIFAKPDIDILNRKFDVDKYLN